MCMTQKIAIASDHGGYSLKKAIKEKFSSYDWVDLGTDSTESVDYPEFGYSVAEAIEKGKVEFGVIVCGTGIGISIAANRNPAVRAALCTDTTMARLTRQHNDANVLALGERIIGEEAAFDIVEVFLNTEFEGGRHARRVEKLSQ
ncbi:MAG: ribose 5-phosphate isomerase B [Alphaproteobacteria bacterium]|nr:ribose 5-phosphate isomerase B [Alphaproteobacteria bacterium]